MPFVTPKKFTPLCLFRRTFQPMNLPTGSLGPIRLITFPSQDVEALSSPETPFTVLVSVRESLNRQNVDLYPIVDLPSQLGHPSNWNESKTNVPEDFAHFGTKMLEGLPKNLMSFHPGTQKIPLNLEIYPWPLAHQEFHKRIPKYIVSTIQFAQNYYCLPGCSMLQLVPFDWLEQSHTSFYPLLP